MHISLLLAVLLLIVLTPLLMVRRARLVGSPRTHPGLAHLDSITMRARWVGLFVGLGVAVIAIGALPHGLGVMLAPGLLGLALVAALTLGEGLVWQAASTRGVASLETRSADSYLPRGALVTLGVVTAALAALLAWALTVQSTGATLGDKGRAYVRQSADGTTQTSLSPFPGQYYSAPMAVILGLSLLVLVLGLALALRRPRNGADPVIVTVDDAARRRSTLAMTASVVVGMTGSLLAALGICLPALVQYHQPWGHVASACVVAATAVLSWAFSVLLVPGQREVVR